MANFHKHGYHGNVKKNLLKGENMKKSLLLSLSHSFIIKG